MTSSQLLDIRRWWTWALVIAAASAAASTARGELTVEALTGAAVTGVGPYYQDVEDAIRKFAKRDYPGALAQLEHAKTVTPRLAPAEVMMAQLYFDANQAPAAIGMLEKVIQRAPGDPEPYVALAERALAEGRLTEAELLLAHVAKPLEEFSDNPRRKGNLQVRVAAAGVASAESRSDWKTARAKLEVLVKLDPKNARVHERLGRALFELGDQRGAFAEFQAASEADKTMPTAELAMALAYKDQPAAEKWLGAAIKKGSSDPRARLGAARLLLQSNRLDEAQEQAGEALKLDPESLEANSVMGLAERFAGNYAAAEKHLAKAHLAPANPLVLNQLALTLIELPTEEQHQQALQYAEINMRQNTNNPEAVATVAWINYRMNRRAEAERAFNMALAANQQRGSRALSADVIFYMATIAKDRGQTAETVKMLKDALATTEPFGYRKAAQAMLDELTKDGKGDGGKPGAATTPKVSGDK